MAAVAKIEHIVRASSSVLPESDLQAVRGLSAELAVTVTVEDWNHDDAWPRRRVVPDGTVECRSVIRLAEEALKRRTGREDLP